MKLESILESLSKTTCLVLISATLVACGESDTAATNLQSNSSTTAGSTTTGNGEAETGRWYTGAQATAGAQVFASNCAVCHGDLAQGLTEDWRAKMDDGSFPPPPLNGSAHAWHHPRSVLLQVVNNGGAAFGGKMPPFENLLNEEEKLQAIAFFQSLWSDEIYLQWEDIDGSN